MYDLAKISKYYKEICLGYSFCEHANEALYVKHFDSIDFASIGECFGRNFDKYINLGAKKQEDILKEKIDSGEWSLDQENQIKSIENNIKLMTQKRSKASIESQIDEIDEIIKDYNQQLSPLLFKKNSFFNSSAEHFADLAVTDFIVSISFFNDKELKFAKFSLEDVEHFEKEFLQKIIEIYHNSAGFIDHGILKHIAINPRFSVFLEKSASPESFFGRHGKDLTRNQVLLFEYAKYFGELIPKIPDLTEEEREDPDKIEEAFILSQSKEPTMETTGLKEAFAKAKNFKLN